MYKAQTGVTRSYRMIIAGYKTKKPFG